MGQLPQKTEALQIKWAEIKKRTRFIYPEFYKKLWGDYENIKFLLLTKLVIINHPEIVLFKVVKRTLWVKPQEDNGHLMIDDYGLLIREKSITNKVAAPTKVEGTRPSIATTDAGYRGITQVGNTKTEIPKTTK